MRTKKRFYALALLSLLGICEGAANADIAITWANPGINGSWSDPGQWSPSVVPDGDYSATLPSKENVVLDVSPTLDALVVDVGAQLQNSNGQSLTTQSLDNAGGIYFTGGGNLEIDGIATNSGATVGQSNGIYLGGGAEMNSSGDLTNTGGLVTGYGDGGNNTVNVTGTLHSSGTVDLNENGDVVNVGALDNQGHIGLDAPSTTFNITGGGQGVTDMASGSQIVLTPGTNFNVINNGNTSSALANLTTVQNGAGLTLESGQTFNFGSLINNGVSHGHPDGIYLGNGTTMNVYGNVTNPGGLVTGFITGGNNTLNITGTLDNSGTLDLYQAGDRANIGIIYNSGSIYVGPGASLNVGQWIGGGKLIVDKAGFFQVAGSIHVEDGSQVTFGNGATTVRSLTIDAGGLVHVPDTLVIDYGSGNASPMPTILSYLQSGYDTGTWGGTGIVPSFSSGQNAHSSGLGYIDTGSEIEIKYTWLGDANCDGVVNSADLSAISPTGATWQSGDFNYDGKVNADDYSLFIFGEAASNGANISATVPEPAGMLAVAVFFIFHIRKRRVF